MVSGLTNDAFRGWLSCWQDWWPGTEGNCISKNTCDNNETFKETGFETPALQWTSMVAPSVGTAAANTGIIAKI